MNDKQFKKFYPRYKSTIAALARKLAKRDDELWADLCQIGSIALWKSEPSRAFTNEDAYLRQLLFNTMVSFLRKERREDFDSLDSLIERGAQVVDNEEGAQMVAPVSRRPRRPADPDGPEEDA